MNTIDKLINNLERFPEYRDEDLVNKAANKLRDMNNILQDVLDDLEIGAHPHLYIDQIRHVLGKTKVEKDDSLPKLYSLDEIEPPDEKSGFSLFGGL